MYTLLEQIRDTSQRLADYIEANGNDCLPSIVHGQGDLIAKRAAAYAEEAQRSTGSQLEAVEAQV